MYVYMCYGICIIEWPGRRADRSWGYMAPPRCAVMYVGALRNREERGAGAVCLANVALDLLGGRVFGVVTGLGAE